MFLKINNSHPETDLELITKYRNSRDTVYVGELFQRYTHFVFGICMKYLQEEEQSKDAVMSIFEKIMEDLKFHNIQNFRPWLFSVTRNYCLQTIRKEKIEEAKQQDYEKYKASVMEFLEEKHLLSNQKEKLLEKAVQSLKEEQQTCIKLFYWDKKSYQAIVEETKLDLNKVKSHIQNGKRNLKNSLEEQIKVIENEQ